MDNSDDGRKPDPTTLPGQVIQPADDAEADPSDDDDWFNKSLDDFDIPTVKDDSWGDEDDTKDEDDDPHPKTKSRGNSPRNSPVAAVGMKDSKPDRSLQKPETANQTEMGNQKGAGDVSNAASKNASASKKKLKLNADSSQHPAKDKESTDNNEENEEEEKKITLLETGVAFVLFPKVSKHFRLVMECKEGEEKQQEETSPSSVPSPSPSPEQEENKSEEKMPAVGQGDKEEKGTTEETATPTKDQKTNRNSKRGQGPHQEESNKATGQEMHGDQEGSDLKWTETAEKKEVVQKSSEDNKVKGREAEQPEETVSAEQLEETVSAEQLEETVSAEQPEETVSAEQLEETVSAEQPEETVSAEVKGDKRPEAGLTEDWFQTKLRELPTLFNQRRIHCLSEARLKANETMLSTRTPSGDKDEVVEQGEEHDNDDSGATGNLLVRLLTSQSDQFGFVFKVEVNDKADRNAIPGNTFRLKSISPRRRVGANFLTVLKWLLGKRQEAVTEARHLVWKYPFSLVATANLFYILWKEGERREAAEHLWPFLQLKRKRPDIYEGIMCAEHGELGYCYMELGPEFIPDALTTLEDVVRKKPDWYGFKWDWALNLRRLTNAAHTWMQPLKDVVTPLLKATELLLELIQDCRENCPEIRMAAVAELGEILVGCELEEKLKSSVKKKALDAGFDVAKCFDIVMQEEDTGGSNLVRAGKYFRFTGQLHKSKEVLKKAVAVQDSAKVHHQFALTLRKMAVVERHRAWENSKYQRQRKKPQYSQVGPRHGASQQSLGTISRSRLNAGDSNMLHLQRAMKSVVYQRFSREDKYVKETMHHLNRALTLSHGENNAASYDLGLMHKALGEYNEALEQFLVIAETDCGPAIVVNAFEQSGLVTLEKCSLEESETRARKLQEDGRSMLNMAILIQLHIVQKYRKVEGHQCEDIWRSCYTLGQYLQLQQEVEGVCKDDSPVEVWLLRLLRVYADTLPVLTFLQQITQHDAQNSQVLMKKLHKYFRDQRHEDAVLFTSLLRLVDQGQVMERDDLNISLSAHVLAARTTLMEDVKAGRIGSSFNTNMAKRYFCWAFEDVYINVRDTTFHDINASKTGLSTSGKREPQLCFREQETAKQSVAEAQRPKVSKGHKDDPATDSKKQVGGRKPEKESSDENTENSQSHQLEEVYEEDDETLEHHVLLLHDPQDPDTATVAQSLQSVLQNTCGLQTCLPESGSMDSMQKAAMEAMARSYLILFVIGKKEISAELDSYLQHATTLTEETAADDLSRARMHTTTDMRRTIMSLTLGDAIALPKPLQGLPSFSWTVGNSFITHQDGWTARWVDSVCKLFSFLIKHDAQL